MKVSVIIPVFNREKYIGSALRSLLCQRDAADLDIVVVDDGSTDGTGAAVHQIMAEAPCVRYTAQANTGVTKARNVGLRLLLADTEFVTFLDSDDISPQARFATDLARFRSDPSLDLTYGLMAAVDEIDDETLTIPDGAQVNPVRSIHLSAAILRRRIVDQAGGFDEDFKQAEDTDFLFRIFERRPRFLLTDTVSLFYRRHSGNLTNDRGEMRREFLKAVLRSAQRRRKNPALGDISALFNLKVPPPHVAGDRVMLAGQDVL